MLNLKVKFYILKKKMLPAASGIVFKRANKNVV